MKERKRAEISEKRLLDIDEGAKYCGLGRVTFRKYADTIKATRKIGSRVLFDRLVIDKALDACTDMSAI